jgi:hypothetical protein
MMVDVVVDLGGLGIGGALHPVQEELVGEEEELITAAGSSEFEDICKWNKM